MGLFRILVLASGLTFIVALFNSFINKNKIKMFPVLLHLDVIVEKMKSSVNNKQTKDGVKTWGQVAKEVGVPITVEGLFSLLVLIAGCIAYVIAVNSFL